MREISSILPLAIDRVGFCADGRSLLVEISFTIARGGATALLGPNGAGKSLLLRLCHGLIAPTEGAIRWAAGPDTRAGVKRHAMVFQKPVMLRRSVLDNLNHALGAAGLDGRARKVRADAAMARFGLEELAARPARLLSGGEQQRLAIARAWALSPEVLFLDEPTAQLDPGATRQIEALLADLKSEGVTLVLATHDLGQTRRLCDRVVFLNRGRLIEQAPVDRFFESPGTAEARAFVAGDLLW